LLLEQQLSVVTFLAGLRPAATNRSQQG